MTATANPARIVVLRDGRVEDLGALEGLPGQLAQTRSRFEIRRVPRLAIEPVRKEHLDRGSPFAHGVVRIERPGGIDEFALHGRALLKIERWKFGPGSHAEQRVARRRQDPRDDGRPLGDRQPFQQRRERDAIAPQCLGRRERLPAEVEPCDERRAIDPRLSVHARQSVALCDREERVGATGIVGAQEVPEMPLDCTVSDSA